MEGSDTTPRNQLWSDVIIEELLRCGVEQFFLSPGLRSAALAKAISKNSRADCIAHFDERSAGFAALGYGKATGKPAVVVCTSGTAVLNLLPAVAEAYAARVPLILLTADRPIEARNSAERQTIDQLSALKPYLRDQLDLIPPDSGLEIKQLLSMLDHSYFKSSKLYPGPVQINAQFREPIISETSENLPLWFQNQNRPFTEYPEVKLCIETTEISEELSGYESGVVVVGELSVSTDYESLSEFLKQLGWPVLADVTSELRYRSDLVPVLRHYDLYLEKLKPEIDCILQFGDYPVSKNLQKLIASSKARHILIHQHANRQDRDASVDLRLVADIGVLANRLCSSELKGGSQLLEVFNKIEAKTTEGIEYAGEGDFSEIDAVRQIYRQAPEGSAIFLASSLPIREADRFVTKTGGVVRSVSNRGIMGIDGTISSAAGFAKGHNGPTILITGDLAFLHDLGALALVKEAGGPDLIVVLNNNGGAIFSMLPVAEQFGQGFDKVMRLEHGVRCVRGAAEMFGLEYRSIETTEDLESVMKGQGNCIVAELSVDYSSVREAHQKYFKLLSSVVN